MRVVGVRALKQRTGEILRWVREHGEVVAITYRGEVIAHLIPVHSSEPSAETMQALWSDLDQLAQEIGSRWPASVSAVEALGENRRG